MKGNAVRGLMYIGNHMLNALRSFERATFLACRAKIPARLEFIINGDFITILNFRFFTILVLEYIYLEMFIL